MSKVVVCRWQVFHLKSQWLFFPLPLSTSLKCRLTWMKKTEWGRTVGTRSGSNSAQYNDQLSQPCLPRHTMDIRTIQTKHDIEHLNVGLALAPYLVLQVIESIKNAEIAEG